MTPTPLRASALAVLLVAACGESSAVVDGGTDASADSTSDAGCIDVFLEGTACSSGDKACARIDLCCMSTFACELGKWKLRNPTCKQCQGHPCGPITCPGENMCITRPSVIDGGAPAYDCIPYPTECARDWTCGCVEQHPPSNCTLAPNSCTDTNFPVRFTCIGS